MRENDVILFWLNYHRERNYLLFSGAQNGRKFLLIGLGYGRKIWLPLMIEVSRSAREENARPQGRPFSCPFSAPAILYRPLAPRTGRGLMEIYDSHLIGFNVPRISSSRNVSSDFFRTVCSFRVLTTSAIKTYVRELWFRSWCGQRVSYDRILLPSSSAEAQSESILKTRENQQDIISALLLDYSSRRMKTQIKKFDSSMNEDLYSNINEY